MTTKLLLDITGTLLRARLRQTVVAAVGVTFGITMFIALLSFMSGLNGLLDNIVANRTAHIRLYNEIRPSRDQPIDQHENGKGHHNFVSSVKAGNSRQEIYNVSKIMQALRGDDRVAGFSRKVASPVFFNDGNVDINGVLNGIDVEAEIRLYHFGEYVTSGVAADIRNVPNGVVLGKPLAETLRANLGDVVQVTTPQGERFQLKVTGFYQSGLADFDKTQSFVSVANAQKVLGRTSNYITDVQVKLHDINRPPALAKEYARVYGIDALDIQSANASFETGTKIRNIISYAVGITLLIVAGFGIYNILNMMIYEKMDAIAILKATGFSGADVKRIFMLISLSIGFFGCLLGLVLGHLLARFISTLPFNSPAVPTLKTFPVEHNFWFYIIAIVFSLLTTYLAGFFPARKASRVDPVAIIRGK